MSEPTRSSQDAVGDQPVNEARAAIYQRLMAAEDRIAHALYARGVDHRLVADALDAADDRLSEAERREDLYVSSLGHFVAALGGRIEVRAVFDDHAVLVRREPDS